MEMMMEGDLLNEKEAAILLKISVFFLRNHRHKGGGPKFIKMGGSVRYHRDDLAEFINGSRRASTTKG